MRQNSLAGFRSYLEMSRAIFPTHFFPGLPYLKSLRVGTCTCYYFSVISEQVPTLIFAWNIVIKARSQAIKFHYPLQIAII